MKRIFGIIMAVALVLCIAGCKQVKKAKLSGAQVVADKAMTALVKGDYDAYAATFKLSEDEQKMLAGIVQEKAGVQFDKKGGIDTYEIGEAELNEDGDEAKVPVHIKFKDGSEDDQKLDFKKEDNEWKQVIDK